MRPPLLAPSTARRPAATALAVLLALAAVTTAAAPGTIRIARGDTLSELAQRHGTTVAALRSANGLAAGDTIDAGGTLVLPSARAAASTAATVERQHVVAQGENVSTIARRYGTSTRSVLARNQLAAGALLQPGQVLAVPVTTRTVGGSAAPTTQTTTVRGTVAASAAQHRATLATRALPSKDEARRAVAAAARRNGVDVSLALAVAYHESGFQMRAVSPVDAIGVMQVLPSTGRDMERLAGRPLDLLRLEDNVTAGTLLLKQLLARTGSVDGALAGYYQGLGSVSRKGVLPQTVAYQRSIAVLRPRFANG